MAESKRLDVNGVSFEYRTKELGQHWAAHATHGAGPWGARNSADPDGHETDEGDAGGRMAARVDPLQARTAGDPVRGGHSRSNAPAQAARVTPWRAGPPSGAREDKALASVIEGDIIPRLVLAHRGAHHAARTGADWRRPRGQARMEGRMPPAADAVGDAVGNARDAGIRAHHGGPRAEAPPTATDIEAPDIEAFTQFILNDDMGHALAVAESWRARGASFENICAGLLQPAACVLDAYCAGDACDFADLTLGLGRLQWVLHDLDRMSEADDRLYGLDRRILLATAPGEGHTFGVSMLSAVFHRAGWDVTDALVVDAAEDLIEFVRDTSYPLVGLWVGARGCRAGLGDTIDALRRGSINPNLRVLVAGPHIHGETLGDGGLGADALAETAPAAVTWAERLLESAREDN